MKKALLILTLVLVLGLTAGLSYAQAPTVFDRSPRTDMDEKQWGEWHKEKMEWKRSHLEEALKNGSVTEEDAKIWEEHFDYVEEFHNKNGFLPGVCHGGYGWNGGSGFRGGYGQGMMRGHGWKRAPLNR